jgi:hypothetical protein
MLSNALPIEIHDAAKAVPAAAGQDMADLEIRQETLHHLRQGSGI